MSELYEFSSTQDLVVRLSDQITLCLDQEIQQRGSAVLAVSGGNSPKALYSHLRNQVLDWEKVTIVLVDERCVPTSHIDSNETMIRDYLLQGHAAQAQFVGWITDEDDLTEAANKANARFKKLTLPLSVVILGMGDDGHTASWFADAPEYSTLIDSEREPAVCAAKPSTAPHSRLTMNYSAVVNTKHMFLQIQGEQKKNVLERALLNATEYVLPISQLLGEDSPLKIYWASS